ncbi:TspO/MBR family protein [Nesterenkonia aerolata]|uniref:TspO/MBR family protein n=1 Tax=Nesterenkonia aerolata TaxID=3074079 RepID=A0ABU2DSL0_9MICC|nr:TspO/MBR family protein [Nesterenkonia sp. LY-0111]MDR8019489.1 TspO/MBR family protein [Nesterenkonia sp. LY-0111]
MTSHPAPPAARSASTRPGPDPLPRRLGVLVSVLLAVVLAAWGAGAFGGASITEAAGGWLDADSTPLAPASGAFRIWSVIYVGMVGYAIWRLTPIGGASARARRADLWVVGSALLNAAWIGVVQADQLVLSVMVILMLLGVLIRLHLMLVGAVAGDVTGRVERAVLDGVFGLYLGWVCVATVANIAGLGGSLIDPEMALGAELWVVVVTVLVLVAVVGLAAALSERTGRRAAPVLAIAWGVVWIAVGRTEGRFEDLVLVFAAAVAAAAALGVPLLRRLLVGSSRSSR